MKKKVSRSVLIALLGGLILAAVIVLSWIRNEEDGGTSPPSAQIAHETPVQENIAETLKEEPLLRPSFDVVRVNQEGGAVMAGKALPGTQVFILDGEEVLGQTLADSRGEWVYLPENPLKSGLHEFSLKYETEGGVAIFSETPVLAVIPEQDAQNAVAVRVDTKGGITVMQGGHAEGLGAISALHHSKGHLSVAGSALPDEKIRLYLGEKLVAEGMADEKGQWHFSVMLPFAATPKEQKLRADMILASGKVRTRAEISFSLPEKEEPPEGKTEKITVIKGDSLWRIARLKRGTGFDYIVIFEANQEQIKDPDLIYPGQVLIVPKR